MPSMLEIYKHYSDNYDQLVHAEDWQQNLPALLHKLVDWKGKNVYEAGIGSGRLAEMYIDDAAFCYGFDREQHMLNACRKRLAGYSAKLQLSLGYNDSLPDIDVRTDVFIEGWSFGHTIADYEDDVRGITSRILESVYRRLGGTGQMLIIESLGTNVLQPMLSRESFIVFFDLLENSYGFTKHVIRTDYMFDTVGEAVDIMGFFFGEKMKSDIVDSGLCVIPEFTGIWYADLG